MQPSKVQESFILIAEDDADDRFLLQAAFEEHDFHERLVFVENGVDVLEFLAKQENANDNESGRLPKFIILDLNMPKKDGREVLKEIKQSNVFKEIPVIIFSTTNNEQEMIRCYELGANSYITKPNSFEQLLEIVATLREYWMQALSKQS